MEHSTQHMEQHLARRAHTAHMAVSHTQYAKQCYTVVQEALILKREKKYYLAALWLCVNGYSLMEAREILL